MRRLESRLQALARQAGLCPRHETMPWCPACDVPEPLPVDLSTMLDTLIDALVTCVGRQGLRDVCLRVPRPPAFDACARCGTSRQCGACQADYGRAIFDTIGLTATERALLERALAECRARQAKRG
jgi:hypothetical protein